MFASAAEISIIPLEMEATEEKKQLVGRRKGELPIRRAQSSGVSTRQGA